MLNKQGFNLWADYYDRTVQLSEENDSYPFAGYKEILNTIFNEAMQTEQSSVLDIGIGTGTLTSKLYEYGHQIDGIDFSSEMIAIAQEKMSYAQLYEWDITDGLPRQIQGKTYQTIISTYTLHHLTDEKKVQFIASLLPLLRDDGKLLIGDVAFWSRVKLEKCHQHYLDEWDHDEFYFVYEELKEVLEDLCTIHFHPVSYCGGIFVISNMS
ncbi:class I SAM-dependent DNA methyltransferase [Allobacillus sp. GCM10007491]|uniref:Class I SAM-dependent methyltransferase n=1 Tax=Allobacillus saliphilus TaxID=2912308 RepID=A0A941CSJ8_9BACI|nr:class I SAM-dependent methyltransferase [Allobacillus saliphilus]MBR7553142.1 class I SAM-dependent methyltransferase [Allobacillus saliphilus]